MRTKPDYSTTMKVGELQTSKGLVALVVKNCKCRRCNRGGFDPWAGKIPWRKAW